jgi:hypothetical protein
MKTIDMAPDQGPRALHTTDVGGGDADSHARFTPTDFFRDAGTMIAVCLVLGLLAQIVLG